MKTLFRHPWVQGALARILSAYIDLALETTRWRFENRAGVDAMVASDEGGIGAFWHGRIAMAVVCRRVLKHKPRRVLISMSPDGEFVAQAVERLGFPAIRGSTGKKGEGGTADKGGTAAFRQALKFMRDGGIIATTPDGPRGPNQVMPLGTVIMAQTARAPVVLFGLAAQPAIQMRSWDAARLPLPFSRGCVVFDGPLSAPRDLDEAGREALRAEWQARLIAAQLKAERLLAAPPKAAKTPALIAYGAATSLAAALAPSVLRGRARRGKEDPERLGERLGHASAPRPRGRLAWLHGASLGESLSLLPLASALAAARPDLGLLVTSGTRTAAEVLAERLPAGVIHQYAPVDTPGAASRFLDHWRPDLGVLVESELWPNLLLGAKARGVRLALLSAKLSQASARGWSRAPRAARTLLGAFDLILARDEAAAAGLRRLGADVAGLADLKFGAEPLPADPVRLGSIQAEIGDRPVILAASTHPGEDEIIIDAFFAAIGQDAAPLLLIAPRHPQRGLTVAALAWSRGASVAVRSAGESPKSASVYVADTVGEMGLWFRLAHLAIMGGSFVADVGGHNPLEPARLGRPFVSGPNVANWASVYADLWRINGDGPVIDPPGLEARITAALAGLDKRGAERIRAHVQACDTGARRAQDQVLALLP